MAFRNPQVAAPLKLALAPGVTAECGAFRNPQVAAPLKRMLNGTLEFLQATFRNPQVAAPLKQPAIPHGVVGASLSATLKLRLH